MWQEDLKDLHQMHPGIHLYFLVMVPGMVIFGDRVDHTTLIQLIHGVRIDVTPSKTKYTKFYFINLM